MRAVRLVRVVWAVWVVVWAVGDVLACVVE